MNKQPLPGIYLTKGDGVVQRCSNANRISVDTEEDIGVSPEGKDYLKRSRVKIVVFDGELTNGKWSGWGEGRENKMKKIWECEKPCLISGRCERMDGGW